MGPAKRMRRSNHSSSSPQSRRWPPCRPAQATKKVFISADMEGISGISASDQLSATGAEYGTLAQDDGRRCERGDPRRAPRRRHTTSWSTTRTAACAISVSRIWTHRCADQPQLQAVRHDGRARRVVRRGHLHRLSRQGRQPRRTLRPYRQRRCPRRARQRPVARRGRPEHDGGGLVRRARRPGDRRRCRGEAGGGNGDDARRPWRSSARSIRAPSSCVRSPPSTARSKRRPTSASATRRSSSRGAHASYKVEVQFQEVDDPGSCRQPADHGASVARHDRVHSRFDAEGLHADPAARIATSTRIRGRATDPGMQSGTVDLQWRASKTTDSSATPRRRRWFRTTARSTGSAFRASTRGRASRRCSASRITADGDSRLATTFARSRRRYRGPSLDPRDRIHNRQRRRPPDRLHADPRH